VTEPPDPTEPVPPPAPDLPPGFLAPAPEVPPSPLGPPATGPVPRPLRAAMIWVGLGLDVLYAALGWLYLDLGASVAGGLMGTLLAALIPLPVGVAVAVGARNPTARGIGLGIALGWALWLVVGAGLCVTLLVA